MFYSITHLIHDYFVINITVRLIHVSKVFRAKCKNKLNFYELILKIIFFMFTNIFHK